MPWKSYPVTLRSYPLIGTTLAIFHKLTKLHNFSSHLSPLTPLHNNPDFLPGLGNNALNLPNTNKPLLATHCFNNNKFKDFTDIKTDNNISDLPLWTYFQIRSYLNHAPKKTDFSRQLNDLETICLIGEPTSKETSLTYRWIRDGRGPRENGLGEMVKRTRCFTHR